MSRLIPSSAIVAVTYEDGQDVDRVMRAAALRLARAGFALAGLVQTNHPRPGRTRCDMMLEDLASGEQVGISQDRGPGARGCRLDVGELLRGIALVEAALEADVDLLILNKFGKTESEGGGFRPLIEQAVASGIPVLIAVPWRNMEAWHAFAGDLSQAIPAVEIAERPGALDALLGAGAAGRAPTEARAPR